MTSHSLRLGGMTLVAVAALSAPSAARAQTWTHSWTLCTRMAFHSCNSVSIQTDPMITGGTQTGTSLIISLANLQGSGDPLDDTQWSGLWGAIFYLHDFGLSNPFTLADQSGIATVTPVGGATTNGTSVPWDVGVETRGDDFYEYIDIARAPTLNTLIGGCASGDLTPPGWPSVSTFAQTCGAQAAITFSFDVSGVVDAFGFGGVGNPEGWFVHTSAYAVPSNSPGGASYDYCATSFLDYDLSPSCIMQSESLTQVTPEPVTIALLGTGLLGIGGVRLRRRKKDQNIAA